MRSKSCRVRALPFVAILLERGRERREDDDGAVSVDERLSQTKETNHTAIRAKTGRSA